MRRALFLAAVLGALLSGLVGPAPAGALHPLWTLTVDVPPDVVTSAPVVVSGRVDAVLGLGGGLDPVTAVTVTLVPTAEGVPDGCRGDALTTTRTPSGGRYQAELHPPCNGPYRVEVTARSRSSRSGDPVTASVKVADPGPAPSAPTAVGATNGVLLRWAPAATPDVVGWRVTGGIAPVDYPAGTTSATVPTHPGSHQLTLVARRWGADGPGGPEVTSPAVTTGAVEVQAPVPPGDVPTPELPVANGPTAVPSGRSGGTSAALPSVPARSSPPGRAGASVPARRTPTVTPPEGYRPDLPYGAPDDAFVPGDAPRDATSAGAGGDDEQAGTTPSANVVQTRERRSPGLVAPFALALLLVTVATHIAWYLRRSRPLVAGAR